MDALRRVAERFSRNKSFRKALPPQFGGRPLWVSGDARLRFLLPGTAGFDRPLFSYVARHVRPGDRVWDVGGNIGQFAFAAAHQAVAGSVVTLEPDPFMRYLLDRSAAEPANADLRGRLTAVGVAASDKVGVARLAIAGRGRASTHLSEVQGSEYVGGTRYEVAVPVTTLDQLLGDFDAPTLVKIDVEGAEHLVLAGGSRVLSEVRPRVLIEVADENVEQVTATFRQFGYSLQDPVTGDALPSCAFNTLAVPA